MLVGCVVMVPVMMKLRRKDFQNSDGSVYITVTSSVSEKPSICEKPDLIEDISKKTTVLNGTRIHEDQKKPD